MWQFSEAIDGLTVACNELGTPITGGNVSFYNETLGKSIYPTPVIGILGIIEDASRAVKIGFREAGDVILLLDGLAADAASKQVPVVEPAQEFSSSEYSKHVGGIVAGEPPAIDLAAEKRLQEVLIVLASERLVQSAHDISDGGIAVAIAESCFASAGGRPEVAALGASIKLDDANGAAVAAEFGLFNERGARVIVSVKAGSVARVLETARQYQVTAEQIGQVIRDKGLRIEYKGHAAIDSPVEELREIWAHSLERAVRPS